MPTQIERVRHDDGATGNVHHEQERLPRPQGAQRAHLPLTSRIPSAHRAARRSVAPPPAAARASATPTASVTATQAPNIVLAAVELLLGYEWLVSGVDKLLYGSFPEQLGTLLRGTLNGNRLPDIFAAVLRALVVPNAALFGVLIEWAETLAGAGLIIAGLIALLGPLAERHLRGTLADVYHIGLRLLRAMLPVAALGTALLGLSFYLLDGAPMPWFAPSIAYGGALDTGLFLAVASLIVLLAQRGQHHTAR